MNETPELANAIVRADSLGLLHSMYLAFPYPFRRVLTALGLMAVLLLKPWINQNRPTPTTRDRLYTLSFWGVPFVDASQFQLLVHGEVANDRSFSLADLEALADTDREVVLDCGGVRETSCG